MSQHIAFFGATGGCAGSCLAATLQAGHDCRALARTPAKLTASLKARGVSADTLDRHLTVIQGDAKDLAAVAETLRPSTGGREVVDKIVSGIGGTPVFQWSLFRPLTLSDPRICQEAGATLLRALASLGLSPTAPKPLLISVSGRGLVPEGTPRDVPLLWLPVYLYLLPDMCADKKVLQDRLAAHVRLPADSPERVLRGFVSVKPPHLTDGDGYGLHMVREGVEDSPVMGHTLRREDVGIWIHARLVEEELREGWMNKGVTIGY